MNSPAANAAWKHAVRRTISACPTCGRDCPGAVVRRSDGVFLDRRCPEHGPCALRLSAYADAYADLDRFYFDVLRGDRPQGRVVNYWVLSTSHCQMKCSYCQVEVERPSFEEMEVADFRAIFARHRGAKLTLSGGEPTLHPDALWFFEAAAARGLSAQLATNGLRVADPGFCRALVEAGVPEVRVSVDSLGTAGPGAADDRFASHRIAALDNLRRYEVPTIVSPTIRRGRNEGLLAATLDYAAHNPFVKSVSVNGFSWVGQARGMDRAEMIMPDEMMDLVHASHGSGERDAIFTLQKLILVALRILDIRLCLYTQIMLFVRDGARLRPLTDLFDPARLRAGLQWWEGYADAGRTAQRGAFAAVCASSLRGRAVPLLPSMVLMALANVFGVRADRYPGRLLPVVLNTNCSLLSADRSVGVRCMSGVLFKQDGQVREGRSTAMLLEREAEQRGDPGAPG
jgi:hypothetical protein